LFFKIIFQGEIVKSDYFPKPLFFSLLQSKQESEMRPLSAAPLERGILTFGLFGLALLGQPFDKKDKADNKGDP
jgi:hypothetical protein